MEKNKIGRVGKFDIDSLKAINPSYDLQHTITQFDVDKANKYIALIESTRSITLPQAGDMLKYTDRYGSYYPHAHIEYNRQGECNVCEQPYVPFIGADGKNGIWCSTSGGAWHNLDVQELKYVGKEQKYFCDWGHCGACANGAVHFAAEVSVWEYIHPQPLYKDFTTEKWRKLYISRIAEQNRKDYGGYLYQGDNMAFRTENEYCQFLSNYKATVFDGHWPDQYVVWCYREERRRVTQEEYDALNLPVISIYCNGQRPAKIEYDDENKIAINYFVMQDHLHQ